MINSATLTGRLTKEVDLRYTPNGKAVANFTLAVNRPFTNSNGEREADFIQCVVWGKPAENLANYTRKGSLIGVEGSIQTRNYDHPEYEGIKVYVTEVNASNVVFLDSKKDNNHDQNQSNNGGKKQPPKRK